MSDRILSRKLAEEMTAQEVDAVSGGACFPSPNTVCTTWDFQWIDHVNCDGGIDCDF